MKESIDWKCYATLIMKSIRQGVLVTAKNGDKVNSMTIGWGSIGFDWSRPIFTAYIRKSRFTCPMILESKEFTVNIPLEEPNLEAIKYLGTQSGRNEDKIKKMNLTLVEGNKVNAPGIKEFPLTLECKVLYHAVQDTSILPEVIKNRYYPEVNDPDEMFNNEPHYVFYGEIVDSYIIK